MHRPSEQQHLESEQDELTRLLNQIGPGLREGAEDWLPEVLAELRRVAQGQLRDQPGHTLQATALVHEAYLRLQASSGGWKDRAHFYALAAKAMRQILVDHARGKGRIKRGAGWLRVTLDGTATADAPDVLDLHALLDELGERDELQGRIVELRFFGGLDVAEVATLLELSKSTVEREWRAARAWLGVRLEAAGN